MIFLIDYENVRNPGMRGTSRLLPTDRLIVFYSDAAPTMEKRHLREIEESGCVFEISKLRRTHKNALDFYIATKVGEIFGSGYTGQQAIVSRDGGFKAVQDYWSACARPARRVLLAESMERALLLASESGQRTREIQDDLTVTNIEAFYKNYEENHAQRETVQALFAGTGLSARINDLETLLKNSPSSRTLYLESLRCFGRRDGLIAYRFLKEIAVFSPMESGVST